jgi:indolepyruvate ferredoxin oxidoreductase beta subunit
MATSIVIVGVGGQGVLTLTRWIGEAALAEGYDVRIAEVHRMSQRGGSVEVHVRFGKEVYPP